MPSYGNRVVLDRPHDQAVRDVREALAEQGFGILTEIDFEAAMREKLGEEVGPYLILGACNPPLAFRAVSAEPSIGLLLPCNIVVRAEAGTGRTVVEAMNPEVMVELTGDDRLAAVADEAAAKLGAALAALSAPTA